MSEQSSAKSAGADNTAEVVELDRFQSGQRAERLSVLKTYKLFIDGQFPRTESGRYYAVNDSAGQPLANICQASRKDLRNSVTAARKAFSSWSERSAYNRGQIMYRIAEMLEGRRKQFIDELQSMGATAKQASREVDVAVDRLIYYAGWSDKYQQIFSNVNPVSSSHFNFSLPEPMGVVTIVAPGEPPLVGLAYYGENKEEIKTIQTNASLNIKRALIGKQRNWLEDSAQDPYQIIEFQETKTTWHPIGQ